MTVTHPTRFDRTSTAQEVAAGHDLRGKLVVLTGPAAGIGQETARVLALTGADLVLGVRNPAAAKEQFTDLPGADALNIVRLDLMEEQSVDSFADAVLNLDRPVDILINNAGIMACPLARDARGLESQFATNFVGHAILTSRLAPALRRSSYARLVSLSSIAHQRAGIEFDDISFERREYDPWIAYGQSKTASCLLAIQAQAALGGPGFDAFAVHPGVIPATGLVRYMTKEAIAAALARSTTPIENHKTVETGAATTVWAALDSSLTGRGPLYLEDCGIAETVTEQNGRYGVMANAMDPAIAERLWHWTEEKLGRALPF
ncbi:MAG: hypothetical protein APF78_05305 [Sphingomonadales bacterium BRH_c3]|nr:MAG: hypothetical protein APF78_05305 [Sphingomonadales bacterium BRH_c3]